MASLSRSITRSVTAPLAVIPAVADSAVSLVGTVTKAVDVLDANVSVWHETSLLECRLATLDASSTAIDNAVEKRLDHLEDLAKKYGDKFDRTAQRQVVMTAYRAHLDL